jgi:hypothetical protein
MTTDAIQNYLAILKIRQVAGRRDTLIVGAVFLLALVLTLSAGLLDALNAKAIYLMAAILTGLGVGFGMTWVRLQIINGAIETIELLQRAH